jgi:phage shock protein PspC (stress-responsive transcriptional regulator)
MNDTPEVPVGPRRPHLREWRRDLEGRKIAGVCAGIAEELGVSVTVVRAAFVLLALPPFSGVGAVLYLVLWFLMPPEDGPSGLDRLVESAARLTADPPRRPRRVRSKDDEADGGW